MDYFRLYVAIIQNRIDEPLVNCYLEKHHIIPKSLGGADDFGNLVALTAKEHFICHYLLAKMFEAETNEWYKMQHAFCIMKANSFSNNRYFNSRLYEALRKDFSKTMSYIASSWVGEKNSNFGKRWISNLTTKETKLFRGDELPTGWIEGRRAWKKIDLCPVCKKQKSTEFVACSEICKQYLKSPHYKIIDEQYDEMKQFYLKTKTITGTLKHFGIITEQKSRKGNSYLSEKLKKDGIYVRGTTPSSHSGIAPVS